MLAVCRGREAVRLAGGGGVKKHIHVEIDALLEGVGPRCLVVDADAELDDTTGALTVAADTLTLTLRTNGSDVAAGGPYVVLQSSVESD